MSCATSAPRLTSTSMPASLRASFTRATRSPITVESFGKPWLTCGVATSTVVPSPAAARARSSEPSRPDGPSSMPGST